MQLVGPSPAPLAVSKAAFQRAAHVDGPDDDVLIEDYLRAAQEVVEIATRRPLTERAVQFDFDGKMVCTHPIWWLPVAPVSAITKIEVWTEGSGTAEINLGGITLLCGFDEPQLRLSNTALESLSGAVFVKVAATVGYGAGLAPVGLQQAIILIVKEWFDHGIALGEQPSEHLSFGVRSLLKQQRYYRPREFGR